MAKKICLYHGTTKESFEKIKEEGLKLPNRKYHNFIYFSENKDIPRKHGEIIIKIRVSYELFENCFGYQEDNGGFLRSYPVALIDIPKELIKFEEFVSIPPNPKGIGYP